MKMWYVVNTKPRKESTTEAHLRNQGFTAWLPQFRKTIRHARRTDTVAAPIFPGYLFVELNLSEDHWQIINNSWGVQRILCQQGRPTPLPQNFVANLISITDSDGILALKEPTLFPGQKLRIIDGPFANTIGILQHLAGKERVAVLLHVFNKTVTTTVPKSMTVAA